MPGKGRRSSAWEDICIDKDSGELIITRQERLNIRKDTVDVNDLKKQLNNELRGIVKRIKSLKARAEEIKEIQAKLEAGPIDPAH
ncbi:hypothetical protein [Desulfoscipio geothermicus]|uniref:Uncharacterized protein n=1 Tax=Desulfoscipio geothermicus DSM 3669 TaxID=1121426 RepID=A0A1I6EGE5_9FIRM|nr:hypothetical protein [Desulfoscipio geothermicus]SFR16813.1 hypothetical protein SAMN05660706_14212 [Desulfoscipio geothermicus DSM 3669]